MKPFLSGEFFRALSESSCIGTSAGWVFKEFKQEENSLYTFQKNHSYGEFIFDWGWAEAYHRHGLNYYPKLTSMIPFTPVTTRHFLMKEFNESIADKLLTLHDQSYDNSNASGAHFLFLPQEEVSVFKSKNYLLRESLQYHFFNTGYQSFDDFLRELKSKRAKTIRQERAHPGLSIRQYTGETVSDEHAARMYRYYISTIENKNSYDYLNEAFFKNVFRTLKENILFIEAYENDSPVAGSLFFFDQEKLYGRYWGAVKYIHNLHFELCYHQGIDFCIRKKLKVFEAGAQGEHKVMRGFRPVKIFSAHKLKHKVFHQAVGNFIEAEKKQIEEAIQVLLLNLPFKQK